MMHAEIYYALGMFEKPFLTLTKYFPFFKTSPIFFFISEIDKLFFYAFCSTKLH